MDPLEKEALCLWNLEKTSVVMMTEKAETETVNRALGFGWEWEVGLVALGTHHLRTLMWA